MLNKGIDPLLHRLFSDHDLIFFLFLDNILKNQKKCYVLKTFGNIMENGAFAPKEQILDFS